MAYVFPWYLFQRYHKPIPNPDNLSSINSYWDTKKNEFWRWELYSKVLQLIKTCDKCNGRGYLNYVYPGDIECRTFNINNIPTYISEIKSKHVTFKCKCSRIEYRFLKLIDSLKKHKEKTYISIKVKSFLRKYKIKSMES